MIGTNAAQAQTPPMIVVSGNSVTPNVAHISYHPPNPNQTNTPVSFAFSVAVTNAPTTANEAQQHNPICFWHPHVQYSATASGPFTTLDDIDSSFYRTGYSEGPDAATEKYLFFVAGYWQVTNSVDLKYTGTNNDGTFYTTNPGTAGTHTAVDVNISYSGGVITNQTQSVIVGQVISLTGSATPLDAVTSVLWSIPEKKLSSWTADANASVPTPINPPDLNGSGPVRFFWYDGGIKSVTYTATITGGQKFTATTTFNVLRPKYTIGCDPATDVSSPNLALLGGTPVFFFGDPNQTPTKQGITFHYEADPQWTLGGNTQWVQMVNSTNRVRTQGDPTTTATKQTITTIKGTNCLDSSYPYKVFFPPNDTSDGPTIPLWADSISGDNVQAAESFQMWLMYKPLGDNSYWVPLRMLAWHWGATADHDSSNTTSANWTLSNKSGQKDSEGDSTTYPSWVQNVTKLNQVITHNP